MHDSKLVYRSGFHTAAFNTSKVHDMHHEIKNLKRGATYDLR